MRNDVRAVDSAAEARSDGRRAGSPKHPGYSWRFESA